MKWASLPLLALALSLSLGESAVAQKLSPREQLRKKINENVLFLMGGQPGAAVQNVEDIIFLRSMDLALTTQEAMNHLKATRELGPNLEQQVTYIATLFPNPLQILARSGAKSISDLNGKKVNFNNKGSATAQFVPNIFKTLGVSVQEFYMAQEDAMEKLRRGEIDATICSCPTPVPAFVNVRPESGLQFVTVPYERSIQASYLPASISKEDYPTLIDEEVETIVAITVLVSYKWPKDSMRYKRTEKF